MQITTALGPVSILSVTGAINTLTAPEFLNTADEVLDSGHIRLILDFGGVDYISSRGLSALHSILLHTRSRHGKLALCCVSHSVSELLLMTGYAKSFAIYPDLAAAQASFG